MNRSFVSDLLKRTGSWEPPGGCSTFVGHPQLAYRNKVAVPVGIVMEHRFAFFHWIQYKQKVMCDGRAGDTLEGRGVHASRSHHDGLA